MLHLAISKLVHHLEHFRPGWKQPLVNLLVHFDRHTEFELLCGHLTLLSCFAIIRSSASRPPAALKAGGNAALNAGASLRTRIARFRSGSLTSIDAGAAINHRL